MSISIETAALKAILFGTLSCKCPVTEETEQAFFDKYFQLREEPVVDFGPIKAIADRNPARTPVHNLLEIASYGHDDPTNFTITEGDALRALGSKFHFNNLVGQPSHLTIRDFPSFLVSHMLVPAGLTRTEKTFRAMFISEGRGITFENVFFSTGHGLGRDHGLCRAHGHGHLRPVPGKGRRAARPSEPHQ